VIEKVAQKTFGEIIQSLSFDHVQEREYTNAIKNRQFFQGAIKGMKTKYHNYPSSAASPYTVLDAIEHKHRRSEVESAVATLFVLVMK